MTPSSICSLTISAHSVAALRLERSDTGHDGHGVTDVAFDVDQVVLQNGNGGFRSVNFLGSMGHPRNGTRKSCQRGEADEGRKKHVLVMSKRGKCGY